MHGKAAAGVLGRGLGQGPRGAGSRGDGAGAGGLGSGLVVVGEQQPPEPVVQVPGDVVGGVIPQEHVRADPGLGAVADWADVQVGIEGPERSLDLGEGLVGGDHLAAVQAVVARPAPVPCKRICKPDAARRAEVGKTTGMPEDSQPTFVVVGSDR